MLRKVCLLRRSGGKHGPSLILIAGGEGRDSVLVYCSEATGTPYQKCRESGETPEIGGRALLGGALRGEGALSRNRSGLDRGVAWLSIGGESSEVVAGRRGKRTV